MRYKNRKFFKDSIGVDILDNIVEAVLDRKEEYVDENGEIDENAVDDIIAEEMDNIIYDADMWEIMENYQRPDEADWEEAYMYALDDVTSEIHDELGI